MLLDLPAYRIRAVKDNRRLLHPTQDVSRHRPEPPRPMLRRRIEQATERIQIVAIHPSPLSRQRVDELRVAVIDDVKSIKPVSQRAHISRINPKSIEQPIGISPKAGDRA